MILFEILVSFIVRHKTNQRSPKMETRILRSISVCLRQTYMIEGRAKDQNCYLLKPAQSQNQLRKPDGANWVRTVDTTQDTPKAASLSNHGFSGLIR